MFMNFAPHYHTKMKSWRYNKRVVNMSSYHYTMYDFNENRNNFEDQVERVNFGTILLFLNSQNSLNKYEPENITDTCFT